MPDATVRDTFLEKYPFECPICAAQHASNARKTRFRKAGQLTLDMEIPHV